MRDFFLLAFVATLYLVDKVVDEKELLIEQQTQIIMDLEGEIEALEIQNALTKFELDTCESMNWGECEKI